MIVNKLTILAIGLVMITITKSEVVIASLFCWY
jgi:hypothetical protein